MPLAKISPQKAKALMPTGAVLVDVREHGERAREHIESSLSLPLSELARKDVPKDADIVIYYCRSGMRTAMQAATLAGKAGCEAYILDGGIEAWRRAGLPVKSDAAAGGGASKLLVLGLAVAAVVALRVFASGG